MILQVAILEDDVVMGKILQDQINSLVGFSCPRLFENPITFLKSDCAPDIVLLDLTMPRMSGLEAIEPILEKCKGVSIIINTVRDDDDTIFEAIKKGAVGYLDKQSSDVKLADVLSTVAGGGAYMTPRIAKRVFDSFQAKKDDTLQSLSLAEKNVVSGILKGLSYKMIADEQGISLNTVRTYVKRIYRKLNINSKGELFNLANT